MKLLQHTQYFDEATQCTENLSLIPFKFKISHLILVGDTQQLPATFLSKEARDHGLGRSLFTRIQNCNEENENCILTLKEQYCMHPEISYWPNMYFYKNKLINVASTKSNCLPLKPYSVFNQYI